MKPEFVHKKTGNRYLVTGTAVNATNNQPGQKLVLYVNSKGQLFAREYAEFYEKFEPAAKKDSADLVPHRCMCVGFRRSMHGTCLSCRGWVD